MNPSDVTQMVTVLLVGLVVVFSVLIILTFSIWLYSKIVRSITGKSSSKKGDTPQNPKKAAAIPVISNVVKAAAAVEDDVDEIMAVIAAAVYYAGLEDNTAYAVKSVRRVAAAGRSAWAMAGILQNINSFFNARGRK